MTIDDVILELHDGVGASRTTLRVDRPGETFPVVAERCAAGIPSLAGETGIDLRAAKTFQFLEREQRTLVQSDLAADALAPPPELIARYGTKAQVLAPIVRDGRLVAFVSVHYNLAARRWSRRDVAFVEDAARRLGELLDAGGSSCPAS